MTRPLICGCERQDDLSFGRSQGEKGETEPLLFTCLSTSPAVVAWGLWRGSKHSTALLAGPNLLPCPYRSTQARSHCGGTRPRQRPNPDWLRTPDSDWVPGSPLFCVRCIFRGFAAESFAPPKETGGRIVWKAKPGAVDLCSPCRCRPGASMYAATTSGPLNPSDRL